MAVKAHELYQGDDWLTYRPTVAQAFDTLDRLQELCEDRTFDFGSAAEMHFGSQEPAADGMTMLAATLVGICDDLDGEIEAVLAELSPHLRHDASHRWMGFEMQMNLKALRTMAQEEHLQAHAVPGMMDKIGVLAERIGFILKAIDQ